MKLNIYYKVFVVLMAMVLIGACKKDLGNYNYNEINQLADVSGLPKEVSAIFGKNILLKPEFKFTQDAGTDDAKYSYEWIYIGPNGLGGSKQFTLATTRNLDMKVNIVAGTYTAYYNITDKTSGVKYAYKFTLKVVNEINEGWIIMCDFNGGARVDMLSLNTTTGTFDLIIDLLATTGSQLKLEGKPVMTYTYPTGLLIGPDAISYGLYFGTDSYTTKVDPNSFKWTSTMGLTYEMFGVIPAGFYADVIKMASGSSSFMIGKENAYYYDRAQNIYYSAPINYINSEQKEFKVAPFIASNHSSFQYANFYDKTNQRFVKYTNGQATCTAIPDPSAATKKFSFSTGMDLAYMQWVPFNGGEIFGILKGTGTTRFLARFNPANNVQSYYDEITGTGIGNADFYAVSPNLGYIFYAVGSKIYEYDMILKTSKLMLELGSKKISYFGFYDFKSTTKYPGSNNLMVGSYDTNLPAGADGSLNIYTVPPVNGDLVLDKSYSGFGRIKSLTYRER
ncbi:hypothetical protein EZ428_10690 [Pedobacter frigiditerrae]|uniref:PKD-like family protein n=1 Tax=Pedobacter frigiditerrae TaxID=2530452 RepID=A0A4R0MZ11_9SPHI|nr:PKD-like family lipoprotein [Pedobacter frigiditerrae]TCC92187.1 hypothetical protein EZ428_10690 [Pedobacter frigiditerrae]